MTRLTAMLTALGGLASLHYTTGSTDTLVSIIVSVGGLAALIGAKLLEQVVTDVSSMKGSL